LTPENKQKRVESCEELLKRYHEEGDQFLLNTVTGDESWIHHFDPEEKRQSMQYRHAPCPRPEKFKTVTSASKIWGRSVKLQCLSSGVTGSLMLAELRARFLVAG
jgi:histone-lysine N-methyltransferase SETMAR